MRVFSIKASKYKRKKNDSFAVRTLLCYRIFTRNKKKQGCFLKFDVYFSIFLREKITKVSCLCLDLDKKKNSYTRKKCKISLAGHIWFNFVSFQNPLYA